MSESKIDDAFPKSISTYSFGEPELDRKTQDFYALLNRKIFELCGQLPASMQAPAMAKLREYAKLKEGEEFDYLKIYFIPSWSILYFSGLYLGVDSALGESDLNDLANAHAMTLLLHLLDDHANDGQIKADHVFLQLRTMAWTNFHDSSQRVANGNQEMENLFTVMVDDYFDGIVNVPDFAGFEDYCEFSRREASTWVVSPMLSILNHGGDMERARLIESLFRSFYLCWRLMDDVHDWYLDALAGEISTGVSTLLVDDEVALWRSCAGEFKDVWSNLYELLDLIRSKDLIGKIIGVIDVELAKTEALAVQLDIPPLVEHLKQFRRPVAEIVSGAG